MNNWFSGLLAHPWADMIIGIFLLLLLAWMADLVVRLVGLRLLRKLTERSEWKWDDVLYQSGAFRHLAHLVPTLIVQFGIGVVPDITARVEQLIGNVAMAGTLYFGIRALGAGLSAVQELAPHGADSTVPVKGYIQLLKIILYVVGGIVMVALLINRSPLMLLSGLGALSAVLLLIFKDTLLGFVASVQISSNEMLRVGDWIEMPSASADGEVMDISLHTVKVRNWDSTITTIPTWRLINESFRNWRGMFDSGGRRIKRALFIDAATVHFLSDEDIHALHRFRRLDTYLQQKQDAVGEWNAALGDAGDEAVNRRRLTNLGTFRAYVQAYLEGHPDIHHDMTCMVRQLATEGEGIPLELYCFTADTAWVSYENVQADIFDHLFAILPEFGLGLYQKPVGADVRQGMARSIVAL
ncbi:MAG: mechanosensitive ion channel family protein [Moraxellaceae bacterium]|nr:mechanosensitive ion channel family protein [Moraxellaceae bacterium]